LEIPFTHAHEIKALAVTINKTTTNIKYI